MSVQIYDVINNDEPSKIIIPVAAETVFESIWATALQELNIDKLGNGVWLQRDKMMQQLSTHPNGTFLRISWDSDKVVIEGTLDTIYETDNGAEMDEEQYQEFFACAVLVKRIVRNLSNSPMAVNSLTEVSIENPPSAIELADGTVIWRT